MNKQLKFKTIDDPNKGKILLATCGFKCGEEIGVFTGNVVAQPSVHTLTIDGQHIEGITVLKYLAHSCNPNALFQGRILKAALNIVPGDELTIDYSVTEPTITNPFQCQCGAADCRGWIS